MGKKINVHNAASQFLKPNYLEEPEEKEIKSSIKTSPAENATTTPHKSKPKDKRFLVYIDSELHESLKFLAKASNNSLNEYIVSLLYEHSQLENNQKIIRMQEEFTQLFKK